MRSRIIGTAISSAVACAVVMLTMTGCDLTDAQIKVISQQAGLFSAVGWIAVDNPNPGTRDAVTAVVTLIGENADKVEGGKTYTEVLYPIVLTYVAANVEPHHRPLTKAGSVAILGGIDILFASNPEWSQREGLVVDIAQAFCLGATAGLAMAEDDPVMQAAVQSATLRTGLKLKK